RQRRAHQRRRVHGQAGGAAHHAVLGVTPDELLTTTRTVRKRLDLTRPVERQVVEECLRIAFQAPNGYNQQDYGWVVVDDPGVRALMADLYRAGMADHRNRDQSA